MAAKCPSCLQVEDPVHLWRCLSAEMQEAAALGFWKFKSFMTLVQMSPLLMECLLIGLPNAALGMAIPDIDIPDTNLHGHLIHRAVHDQGETGLVLALNWRLAKE